MDERDQRDGHGQRDERDRCGQNNRHGRQDRQDRQDQGNRRGQSDQRLAPKDASAESGRLARPPAAAPRPHKAAPSSSSSVQASRARERAGSYTSRLRYSEQRRKRERKTRALTMGVAAAVVVIAAVCLALRPAANVGTGGAGGTDIVSGTASASGDTRGLPTPIMAEADGVKMHCAVKMEDLTELLLHNASYTYALPLTTQLSEATNVDVMAAHGTGRKAFEQPTGDSWMTGEFIRTYRSNSAGEQMSAIDCGGPVGATVYAPVSGKVVLVKEYQLYGEYPDIQIHIRPEGRSDLDCVLIHLTDAQVKAGDTVTAGETPIARIRDVYAYIGESMQLKAYTAEGDNGNHTHIQMNNVNDPEYHGLDDVGTQAAQ